MKRILFFCFLLVSFASQAQTDSTFTNASDSSYKRPITFLEIAYGKKLFSNSFYDQLNTLSKPQLSKPINCIGLGLNGYFLGGVAYHWWGHVSLIYIIPQKITVDTTEHGKMTGFMFSCTPVGWNLMKHNKSMKLIFSLGANMGRLRMIGDPKLRQVNSLIAPMVSLCPKIKLGKITLALDTQFDYDISGTSWYKTSSRSSNPLPLQGFRQTGLTTLLYLGLKY